MTGRMVGLYHCANKVNIACQNCQYIEFFNVFSVNTLARDSLVHHYSFVPYVERDVFEARCQKQYSRNGEYF